MVMVGLPSTPSVDFIGHGLTCYGLQNQTLTVYIFYDVVLITIKS